MPNTELKLVYQNDLFGKKNQYGKYGIRSDIKSYELLIDNQPVISIVVEYERFNENEPNYSAAYVSYNNLYFHKQSEFNNKGYATIALKEITEILLKEGLVPVITLQITADNERSIKVAKKAGYLETKPEEYSVYHKDAIKMFEEGLSYLKDEDEDLYDMQLKARLDLLKKYISQKKEKENEDINKHTK